MLSNVANAKNVEQHRLIQRGKVTRAIKKLDALQHQNSIDLRGKQELLNSHALCVTYSKIKLSMKADVPDHPAAKQEVETGLRLL